MNPMKMPGMKELGKPRNWDEERHGKCIPLPYYRIDGVWHTFWVPSWKERLLLMLGRPVQLRVLSEFHPPVSVDVP